MGKTKYCAKREKYKFRLHCNHYKKEKEKTQAVREKKCDNLFGYQGLGIFYLRFLKRIFPQIRVFLAFSQNKA